MDTEELEKFLKGNIETQRIEIKSAVPWDKKIFAKAILSLSNIKGGGYIIVGVANDFVREGVDDVIIKSYNIDTMKDTMRRYADPPVNFTYEIIDDFEGKKYICIKVFEFEDVPIICKTAEENIKLLKSAIYYRNSDGRYESAPISNANDLRQLIEYAAIKKMKYWKDLGLNFDGSTKNKEKASKKFDEELGDL